MAIMPIADKVVVLDSGLKIAEDEPERIVNDDHGHRGLFSG
jgi:ABC-type branched-subunit amino acid transport system ATPase component